KTGLAQQFAIPEGRWAFPPGMMFWLLAGALDWAEPTVEPGWLIWESAAVLSRTWLVCVSQHSGDFGWFCVASGCSKRGCCCGCCALANPLTRTAAANVMSFAHMCDLLLRAKSGESPERNAQS